MHSTFDDPSKPLATEFMIAVPDRPGFEGEAAVQRVRDLLAEVYPQLRFSVCRLALPMFGGGWMVMPMVGTVGLENDAAEISARPDPKMAEAILDTLENLAPLSGLH